MAGLAATAWLGPEDPEQGAPARLGELLSAGLRQPLFLVAIGLFGLLSALARRLDRGAIFELSREEVHHVAAAPPPGPLPSPAGGIAAAEPVLRERDAAVRRLRLEALTRGQPDLPTFLDELVAGAFREGASDIHLQPGDLKTQVAFRVRGELRPVVEIPVAVHGDLVRRILVLAQLPSRRPAEAVDGRLRLELDGQQRDVRLSLLPTRHGDNVVLRFGGDAGRYELAGLGFLGPEQARFEALLAEPQGLVVLCGPTGSGKTTTLYSALGHLHEKRPSARIATLEDPIELELAYAAQTQVDRLRGLDFAGALRAALRQDPNVLLIGEVRDAESAKIAVQAGLSGHLILTSLHADSSLGVVPRLIDLGIEPFLVASATLGIAAQRQIDRLCPDCRRPSEGTRTLLDRAGLPAGTPLFRADGCNSCHGKGRQGRRALFEVLHLDEELRRLITQKAPAARIERAALDHGWRPLRAVGIAAALAGEVALEDVLEKLR